MGLSEALGMPGGPGMALQGLSSVMSDDPGKSGQRLNEKHVGQRLT